MRYINIILLFLLSCSNKNSGEMEFTSYKHFLYFKSDSIQTEYSRIYKRQRISHLDSIWKTENILDSIYFYESYPINKSYFKSTDTLDFQIGDHKEKIVVENQNKYHYELNETNNTISFKNITYPIPILGEEIPPPPDSIEIFNNFDYRVYNIDSKEYKIYSFGYLGMCDDCDHVVYFSKEFGEIASYSIDWGHLEIIDSIPNKNSLWTLRKIIEELKSDDQFFPIPKTFKNLDTN
ncbi:hypothetical protein [Algoriphagus litoralis]|uniref:hypothetical protein n=1 Tax=Algoriphagus litoralis TaxID=2202829 RepID=UPI0013008C44|nr:hypothetical protein [Algoriphagus litoralis]